MLRKDQPDGAQRLTTLFVDHFAEVRGFVRRRVGPEVAEEIVAETFLVAWRRIDDVPEQALPWLYRVAGFKMANYRRRERTRSQTEQKLRSQPLEIGVDVDPAEHSGLTEAVAAAFANLAPADQEILRLAIWEELSSRDGARVLDCSVTAYRVRLHRARSRLVQSVLLIFPEDRQSRSGSPDVSVSRRIPPYTQAHHLSQNSEVAP